MSFQSLCLSSSPRAFSSTSIFPALLLRLPNSLIYLSARLDSLFALALVVAKQLVPSTDLWSKRRRHIDFRSLVTKLWPSIKLWFSSNALQMIHFVHSQTWHTENIWLVELQLIWPRFLTEVLAFRMQLSKDKWLYICNIYVPPVSSKGQDVINLRTDVIPCFKCSLICGDLKVRSVLWDNQLYPDPSGEKLMEWIFDNILSVLKNSDGTCFDWSLHHAAAGSS